MTALVAKGHSNTGIAEQLLSVP
ncbi:hypothetical protein ACIPC1_21945 [Streptomyces sp. NPDC087263]